MKFFTMSLLLIFALGITSVMAQGRTVSGKVTDSGSGQPIIGATVLVEGTSNGAYTMDGGEFIIANVEGAVVLDITFMGYTDKVLQVSATQTRVEIAITPSAMQMDEIVVVAYGTADKKSLTGSVAVISSDDIAQRPITNATSAIAGMSPGIIATTASGAPGSSPEIRIRGIGSINSSSSPLYVVDGVPYTGDISNISSDDIQSMSVLKDAASTALYGSRASNGVVMIQTKTGRAGKITFDVKINQGFMYRSLPEYEKVGAMDWYTLAWESERNRQYFQNGRSLESSAQYATDNAFAADGNQWFNILTNNDAGTQMPNADVFNIQPWDGYSGPSWTRATIDENARIMDGYRGDLDWIDHASGLGYRQNYTISASGGTEKTSYFTSVGYTDEDGYFANTSYDRLNARAKVDVTPTNWLKFGVNLSTSFSNSENPYDGGASTGNPWNVGRFMAPIYPVHEHDMTTGNYILDANGNKKYDMGKLITDDAGNVIVPTRGQLPNQNVFYTGEHNKNGTSTTNLFGQVYAAITFLKDFKFTIDGSMNNTYQFLNSFDSPTDSDPDGGASNAAYRYLDYNFKQTLEWGRSFDKHSIDILIGHENFQKTNHYLSASKTGEIFPGSMELDNFSATGIVVGTQNMYRSEGYFGRANYNYDEKYYFSTSYRRDGSSKFSPQNSWGNFWSVGASWIVSAEEFMSNAMWVDFLKFRISYGTNGNDGGFDGEKVGLYAWQTTYTPGNFLGDAVLTMNTPGYPNLMWETAGALDLGIDFRFWNRLNGSLGYFEKSSDELIFEVPVPFASGINKELQNVGSMVNRGIEVALDIDIIRKKDWVWNVGVNLTWMQNRITNLPGYAAETGILTGFSDSQKLMVGHSIYSWYLPQTAGVDPQDGATYFHVDPDKRSASDFQIGDSWYTKLVSNAFKDFSGDGLSPISGALTTSLAWKNLTLDVLFTYRIGGKAFDNSHHSIMGAEVNKAWSASLLDAWRKPGDVTSLPRLQDGNTNLYLYNRPVNLIDNSYIALQNVTLSYQFPKKIANKLTLKGLSVYASGENLFQISALKGYDAMSSFNGLTDNTRFGSMATISFGINVSF